MAPAKQGETSGQGPAGATGDSGTDTVGALSCASGQVALFDGAAWDCKTAVVVRSVVRTRNTALEETDYVGLFTSVAIGDDENPVISYYDITNGDLAFARVYFAVTGIAYQ